MSLSSMTGYGRGHCENRYAVASVELRSVNGKGFNVKLRLPYDRMELEGKLEALLRREIERGSLSGQVRVQLVEASVSAMNLPALRSYLAAWRKAEKELGLTATDPSMVELLALPGAQQNSEEPASVSRGVEQAVLEATTAALAKLIEARRKEGARLTREIQRLGKRLQTLQRKAARRVPAAKRMAFKRLQERVQQALESIGSTEPIDLARELVVLAERADIQEEIARLEMHLARFFELMHKGGGVGRELEFLLQECHREVTTMGNKSADQDLSELVVAMKTVVQQMKEQLANVA